MKTYTGDVRDADSLVRAGVDFIERFGVPDIVIGNAGISFGYEGWIVQTADGDIRISRGDEHHDRW